MFFCKKKSSETLYRNTPLKRLFITNGTGWTTPGNMFVAMTEHWAVRDLHYLCSLDPITE